MKEFLDKYKSNPDFKKKVLIGGGMGIIGVIIILSGMFLAKDGEKEQDNTPKVAIQNYNDTPIDTTLIQKQTSDYRKMEMQKDTVLQVMNDSYGKDAGNTNYTHNTGFSGSTNAGAEPMATGGGGRASSNTALNEYMKRRNQSIERAYNSQPSTPTYSKTQKSDVVIKGYEPRSTNIQPYSVPTQATTYSSAPIVQQNNTSTRNNEERPLTAEEKLQRSIANKYNSGGGTKGASSVKAQIYSDQKISSKNSSVRILLKEKLYFNNVTIGTDAFVYGIASLSGDNMQISVPSISYKGTNYPVNLVVYDYRTGAKGIPIKADNIVGTIGDEVERQGRQEIGRQLGGRISSVVGGIFNGSNKSASIQLADGHLIYLKSQ